MQIRIILFCLCLALTSCYHVDRDDDEMCTVPVTNNPHAMPGSIQSSPMPSMF